MNSKSVNSGLSEESAALENVYRKWESRGPARVTDKDGSTFYKTSTLAGSTNDPSQKIPCVSIHDIPLKVHLPNLGMQMTLPTSCLPPNYAHIQQIPSCQTCTPNSRHNAPYVYQIGMRDVFSLSSAALSKSWIAKLFPITYQSLTRNCSHHFPNLTKQIMSSRSLEEGVEQLLQDDDDMEREKKRTKCMQEARKLLKKISAKLSSWSLRFVGHIFYTFMPLFIKNLYVNRTQINTLREVYRQHPRTSFLYLPTHQSHLDYFLITFSLFDAGLPTPLIAAGMNLFIPFFSSLLRSVGAFYIYRARGASNQPMYSLVLKEYVTAGLEQGCHLEFFPEGTRSRSGKVNIPKNGLMSIVLDAILDRGVPDVYIIPTTISYDCVFEEGIVREMMGREKVPESFLQAIQGMFKIFARYVGTARVDFGQPFSLQEFARTGAMVDANDEKVTRFCPHIESDRFRKVKCLMNHVQYDWTRIQPTPGTAIVCYLLLNAFREGATLLQIETAYSTVQQEALLQGRIFLNHEQASQVVRNSLDLLSHLLLQSADELPVYKPNLRLEQNLELFYYSNKAIYLFINESIIACALAALQNEFSNLASIHLISRQQLLLKARSLCQILSKEFIFVAPCQDLSSVVLDAVERMVTQELFQVREHNVLTSQERGLLRVVAVTTSHGEEDWEPEGETMLSVSQAPEHQKWLSMFRSALAPYILSYSLSGQAMQQIFREEEPTVWPMNRKVLEKRIHTAVCKGALNEGLPESCSIEIVRSWLLHMVDSDILTTESGEQNYMLSSADKLERWRLSIDSFRSVNLS